MEPVATLMTTVHLPLALLRIMVIMSLSAYASPTMSPKLRAGPLMSLPFLMLALCSSLAAAQSQTDKAFQPAQQQTITVEQNVYTADLVLGRPFTLTLRRKRDNTRTSVALPDELAQVDAIEPVIRSCRRRPDSRQSRRPFFLLCTHAIPGSQAARIHQVLPAAFGVRGVGRVSNVRLFPITESQSRASLNAIGYGTCWTCHLSARRREPARGQ
jgi:hypothetical protein